MKEMGGRCSFKFLSKKRYQIRELLSNYVCFGHMVTTPRMINVIKPVRMLDSGNSFEARIKYPIRYRTGNLIRRTARSTFLDF